MPEPTWFSEKNNAMNQEENERACLCAQLELYARRVRICWLGPFLTFLGFWLLNGGTRRALVLWKIRGASTALLVALLLCLSYLALNLYAGRCAQKALDRLKQGGEVALRERKRLLFLNSQILPFIFVMLVFVAGVFITRPHYRQQLPPESRLPQLTALDEGSVQTRYVCWSEWTAPRQEELVQLIPASSGTEDEETAVGAGFTLQSYTLRRAEDAEKLFALLEQGAAAPQDDETSLETLEPMLRRELPGHGQLLLSVGKFLDREGRERFCAVLCKGHKVLFSYYLGRAEEGEWLKLLAASAEEEP